MTPIVELNYVNSGAERTIILAFEMDLVQELPEAMLLRLLTGTHNKVIGLSATSGFSHTKTVTSIVTSWNAIAVTLAIESLNVKKQISIRLEHYAR